MVNQLTFSSEQRVFLWSIFNLVCQPSTKTLWNTIPGCKNSITFITYIENMLCTRQTYAIWKNWNVIYVTKLTTSIEENYSELGEFSKEVPKMYVQRRWIVLAPPSIKLVIRPTAICKIVMEMCVVVSPRSYASASAVHSEIPATPVHTCSDLSVFQQFGCRTWS